MNEDCDYDKQNILICHICIPRGTFPKSKRIIVDLGKIAIP